MKDNRRSTGISDKYGLEIFEGDILRAGVWSAGELVIVDCIVQYSNGMFWLKALDGPKIYNFISIIKTSTIKKDCRNCTYFEGCECFDGKTCDQFNERKGKTKYEKLLLSQRNKD